MKTRKYKCLSCMYSYLPWCVQFYSAINMVIELVSILKINMLPGIILQIWNREKFWPFSVVLKRSDSLHKYSFYPTTSPRAWKREKWDNFGRPLLPCLPLEWSLVTKYIILFCISTDAVSVPIVLLVLEGGPGTLETVHQAIHNNTPSVIVKGSGRAADILAYAYQNSKEEEIEATDQEGKKQKKYVYWQFLRTFLYFHFKGGGYLDLSFQHFCY